MAAAFENVKKAGEIGVEIGVRILQRIAHARLRGEMHHRTEVAVAKHRLGAFAVGKIELVKGESAELPQHGKPRLLERGVVVVVDAVDADDGAAAFQKPPRQRKADEACSAGDQNWSLRACHGFRAARVRRVRAAADDRAATSRRARCRRRRRAVSSTAASRRARSCHARLRISPRRPDATPPSS